MKKLTFLFLMFPVIGYAQNNGIASTENEIKKSYSVDQVWHDGYNDAHNHYIYTDIDNEGEFIYYFSKQDNKCYTIMYIPLNIEIVNSFAKVLNKKYVATSDTSWTAYGGDIVLKVTLERDREAGVSYFTTSK